MPGRGNQLLSVVLATRDPGAALLAATGGLDAQTLPTTAYEVIVADDGSTDGSLDRLRRYAAARPNVALVAGTVDDALSVAVGTWVLVLDQHDRLLPEALTRLLRAAGDDVDVVVARRLRGEHGATGPRQPGETPSPEWARAVRLVRRDSDGTSGAGRSATVWEDAVVRSPGSTPAPPAAGPATVRWQGSVLRIDVDGADPGDAVVLAGADGGERALATTVTDGRAGATLDVASASRPPDGPYRVRLRGATGAADVPARGAAPALLAGYPVAVHAPGGVLVVDLGAQRTALLPRRLDLRHHEIVESAAGTELRVPLPRLHVEGPGRLPGTLYAGERALPATVRSDGETAELRCHLVGLPGRVPVQLQVGGRAPVPIGADLVVSTVGDLTLVPTLDVSAGPGPDPDPTGPAAAGRARRHLPRVLEPGVRRLATVTPARDLYRRLRGH